MESFVTDEGKVNLIVDPDEPGGWRVEVLENDDASGSLHFTVFGGPMAERRARLFRRAEVWDVDRSRGRSRRRW
jgi:hypothetical protein